MNNTFLAGYVGLADGEKDPRNLSLAFPLARIICIEFDIAQHVEVCSNIILSRIKKSTTDADQDLFNITFCYFPISFKAPTDETVQIAPEDLRSSLWFALICATHLVIRTFLNVTFV